MEKINDNEKLFPCPLCKEKAFVDYETYRRIVRDKTRAIALIEAIALLRAWTRSGWKDFVKENESPLMHNTKKWLESYDNNSKNGE